MPTRPGASIPIYKRVAQGYLAFCDAIDKVVDDNPDWRKRERARFLTGILTSAMAPTNTLIGNPAALKKAYETGGKSLLRGTQNLVHDIRHNRGMPSQVKKSDFKVGENLAATPGAVVLRTERFELLQTQPTTEKVYEIPTLVIPPPIGKFYFIDLSPGRSFTEYAAAKGFQLFTMSWRNPHKEQGDWGIDDYIESMLEAVDAVCSISGSKKVNISGFCAGGIMTTLMLSYMAAVRDNRVNAAAFGVMLLDFDTEAPIGALQSKRLIGVARKRSQKQGIHPASALAHRVHVDAPQRPRLELLGQQLSHRTGPAELRHPGVERGRHQPAGQAARTVPRPLRNERAPEEGQHQGPRQAARPWQDQGADARDRRHHRPSHAVEGLLSHDAAAGRAEHVRAEQCRAYRVARQSAGQPEGHVLARSQAGIRSRAVAAEGDQAHRHVVGGVGRLGGQAQRAARSLRRRRLGNRKYKVLGKAPGTYVMEQA